MTMRTALVVLSLLSGLSACDGHLVRLNIREQQVAHQNANRRTLYSCGVHNVPELVRAIAESLNLVEEPDSTDAKSQSKYKWRSPDRRFMLFLENQSEALWRAELIDWPSPFQSELSSHAEAKLRQSLKTSCSPT